MKIISILLKSLAIFLTLIFIAKIIYWLKTDEPISRGSLLILVLFITSLTIRNPFTYILLGGLALFCFGYKIENVHISGYLIVDFMASFSQPRSSICDEFYYLPYFVYLLVLFLMIFPATRKLYCNLKVSS